MCSLNQFFNAVNYALQITNYHNLFLKVKQYQILESVILKRDTIGILPTGYGKSIIFHLLPFAADYLSQNNTTNGNIALIVTPLNAIIDDQISFLQKHGIEAVALNAISVAHVERESDNEEDGTKTSVDRDCQENGLALDPSTKRDIKEGKFKIIYAHPEAFISCKEGRKLLMSNVIQQNVFACVIDEGRLMSKNGELNFAKTSPNYPNWDRFLQKHRC
jgi:superfamily II DNA helicase RecQ